MKEAKSFDVWLGVKLTVSLDSPIHENDMTYRAAVERGANWLANGMQEAYIKSNDVEISGPIVDLSDAAVRLLNQQMPERSPDAIDALGATDEAASRTNDVDLSMAAELDK